MQLVLEHADGLARSELTVELDDLTPNALADALVVLKEEGVVVVDDDRVHPGSTDGVPGGVKWVR
ncbi:MAG TPA: hypothetical protein VIK04_11920 [Solirubrobacteraceae bacterium]